MKIWTLLPLLAIISVILTVGSILILTESLPEHKAKDFNPLSELSFKSDLKIIKKPSAEDNTFIYAVNDVAEQAFYLAMEDQRVQQIADNLKGRDVIIAAVQPTTMERNDGEILHGSVGQIQITGSWQIVDGSLYSTPEDFNSLQDKVAESHQQIWTVIVDVDGQKVADVLEHPERIMNETIHANLTYMGMNMFLPDAVRISPGSTIKWQNDSYIPHNVVGTYRTASGSEIHIDSNPVEHEQSWQYTFTEAGTFEYHCTYHSDEGMNGMIIINGV